jgi:TPR repeat protein
MSPGSRLGSLSRMAVIVATLFFNLASAAFAQGLNAPAAEKVIAAMRADPAVLRLYGACPGDRFRRAGGGNPGAAQSMSACAANPSDCWRLCAQVGSGDACFFLARAFQDLRPNNERYSQILFTMACARGTASGCTNRAAGVRNGEYTADPLRNAATPRREACLARSFETACRNNDPWGCAMTGQAFENGEGASRDLARARVSYEKACALSQDQGFAACVRAREGLKSLDRQSK